MHTHFVARQCARLVRTDYGYGAHSFAGVHLPDEVVGLEHAAHVHCEAQCDAHRQPFRNCHDHDGYGYHEVAEYVVRYVQPVALCQVAGNEDAFDYQYGEYGYGEPAAYLADDFGEAGELFVKRCGLFALRCGLLGYLAVFGGIADCVYLDYTVSFRYGGTP